jgi:serine/threonine-protein kinase HipA
MSVNGKFEGIAKADLLDLADRFLVPSPSKVLNEVLDAVSCWPQFAETAGVPSDERDRVRTDQARFRPE